MTEPYVPHIIASHPDFDHLEENWFFFRSGGAMLGLYEALQYVESTEGQRLRWAHLVETLTKDMSQAPNRVVIRHPVNGETLIELPVPFTLDDLVFGLRDALGYQVGPEAPVEVAYDFLPPDDRRLTLIINPVPEEE